jgi:hypothetical protein
VPVRTLAILALLATTHPLGAQETWRLVEQFRLGGADQGPEAFSDIRGLVVDARGRILVLDFATQDIRIFDSAGRHVRTAGRPGSGPGEFLSANGLALAPDGAFWINDFRNGRLTVLDPEGAYRSSHLVPNLGWAALWHGYFDGAGRLHDPVLVRDDAGTTRIAYRRFSADLARADTLPQVGCRTGPPPPAPPPLEVRSATRVAFIPAPFHPAVLSVHDGRGGVWCGRSDQYRVVRQGLERGDSLGALRGTRPAPPVTSEDRRRLLQSHRERFPDVPFDEGRIPRVKPVFERLHVDDHDRVWVRLTSPDDSTRYEIWSPDGRLLARLATSLRFVIHHPLVFRAGRLYGIVLDEDDLPYVVQARVIR